MRPDALVRALAVLALALGGCGGDESGRAPQGAEVELRTPESGQPFGSASLTAAETDTTRVIVELKARYGAAERARIRKGACSDVGSRVRLTFPLDAVSDTTAEAEIDASLDSLTGSDHVLEVDRGGAHGGEYLACGAIVETAAGDR